MVARAHFCPSRRSRTIWLCASCYACTTRCPAGIKITDIIYALKRLAMARPDVSGIPELATLLNPVAEFLSTGGKLRYITSGCVRSGNGELAERLKVILEGLADVVDRPARHARGVDPLHPVGHVARA